MFKPFSMTHLPLRIKSPGGGGGGRVSLSLSHFVPEILGPKFGLIFHQNVFFNTF